MEVITIDSQVYKNLTAKIGTIAKFVTAMQGKAEEEPEVGRLLQDNVIRRSDEHLQDLIKKSSIAC